LSLAVITLSLAIVTDVMFFGDQSITGGTNGLTIPAANIFGVHLNGITDPREYAVAVLIISAIIATGVALLRKSSFGTRTLAIRSNERGAVATGISAFKVKLLAFMVAGFIAGIGGSLQAYRELNVTWADFAYTSSLLLVAYAYIGGITTISGAVAAGLLMSGGIVTALFNYQGNVELAINIAAGLGVISMVIRHPDGIGAVPRQLVELLKRKRQASGSERGDPVVLAEFVPEQHSVGPVKATTE
jgi:branched-chain amino acid transport system permease protein